MKILKYLIAPKVKMPAGATILELGIDPTSGKFALWALCDPDAKPESRHFMACKTGEELPESVLDCVHLRTIAHQAAPGKAAVTHFFEVPRHIAKKAGAS